jgi:hypothetical protein
MGNIRSTGKAWIVILVALMTLVGGHGFLAAAHGDGQSAKTHIVSSGESLWTLAKDHAEGQDPRSYIHQIQRLNRMSSAQVFPGQMLILP